MLVGTIVISPPRGPSEPAADPPWALPWGLGLAFLYAAVEWSTVVDMQQYLQNRVRFPLDELAKHRGEWVAWSPDGTRVVASSRDPEVLDDLIRAAGADPEECPVEGIPDTDSVLGVLNIP
jgi:hypothetical protein